MQALRQVISFIGLISLLVGCANSKNIGNVSSPADGVAVTGSDNASLSSRPFPKLLTSPDAVGERLPDPALIPSTGVLERLPQLNPGRSDPFAAIATSPIVSSAAPPPPPLVSTLPAVPVPPDPTLLPTVPISSAPLQLPAPANLPQPSLPAASPQTTRPPVASRPVRMVEVTGVVQIGTRLNAIVQIPDGSSRYVSEGDSLASGRILVKRIEMVPNQEPRVILIQDGVEIVRMVGSSS